MTLFGRDAEPIIVEGWDPTTFNTAASFLQMMSVSVLSFVLGLLYIQWTTKFLRKSPQNSLPAAAIGQSAGDIVSAFFAAMSSGWTRHSVVIFVSFVLVEYTTPIAFLGLGFQNLPVEGELAPVLNLTTRNDAFPFALLGEPYSSGLQSELTVLLQDPSADSSKIDQLATNENRVNAFLGASDTIARGDSPFTDTSAAFEDDPALLLRGIIDPMNASTDLDGATFIYNQDSYLTAMDLLIPLNCDDENQNSTFAETWFAYRSRVRLDSTVPVCNYEAPRASGIYGPAPPRAEITALASLNNNDISLFYTGDETGEELRTNFELPYGDWRLASERMDTRQGRRADEIGGLRYGTSSKLAFVDAQIAAGISLPGDRREYRVLAYPEQANCPQDPSSAENKDSSCLVIVSMSCDEFVTDSGDNFRGESTLVPPPRCNLENAQLVWGNNFVLNSQLLAAIAGVYSRNLPTATSLRQQRTLAMHAIPAALFSLASTSKEKEILFEPTATVDMVFIMLFAVPFVICLVAGFLVLKNVADIQRQFLPQNAWEMMKLGSKHTELLSETALKAELVHLRLQDNEVCVFKKVDGMAFVLESPVLDDEESSRSRDEQAAGGVLSDAPEQMNGEAPYLHNSGQSVPCHTTAADMSGRNSTSELVDTARDKEEEGLDRSRASLKSKGESSGDAPALLSEWKRAFKHEVERRDGRVVLLLLSCLLSIVSLSLLAVLSTGEQRTSRSISGTSVIPDVPEFTSKTDRLTFRTKRELVAAVRAYYDSPGDTNISNWNVGMVQDFSYLFAGRSLTGVDISSWDVSNGATFAGIFLRSEGVEDLDILHWNVTKGIDFSAMFASSDFNGNISLWDTPLVTDMSYMFYDATSFNQPLPFDTSAVTDMSYMFYDADSFNQPLPFDTSVVTDMSRMFLNADSFNQPMSFDTSAVTDMSYMFAGALSFNQPLSFDTSVVTDMSRMFSFASSFNQPLPFDTSAVTDMSDMFNSADSFNQPLSFDTSAVTDMSSMFWGADSFNQPLPFDTSAVTTMSSMFLNADSFNQPLSFDTSAVTDMGGMFRHASSFNQPLPFDTSAVSDMSSMLQFAESFNQPLPFDTSAVTDMSDMFWGASSFNQPLPFDTSAVTDMSWMFQSADSFNQPLSFDTSAVTDMSYMFRNALSFNQNLCHFYATLSKIQSIDFVVGTACPAQSVSEEAVCQSCVPTMSPSSLPSGAPSTTASPTMSPSSLPSAAPSSSASPTAAQAEILLSYQGGPYADEQSIEVKDIASGELVLLVPSADLPVNGFAEYSVQLDVGDYEIVITDSYGDGFAGESQAFLRVYLRGTLIWELTSASGGFSTAHFEFSNPLNGTGTESFDKN